MALCSSVSVRQQEGRARVLVQALAGYVKRRMVASAPAEKIQGWLGWKRTSRTPKSWVSVCPFSTFTGTMRGFWSRSLQGDKEK